MDEIVSPLWIRTFLKLVETRSFTAAARALAMTQPGVSQQIRRLETCFGTTLIAREGRRFELTESGRKLVEYGKALFEGQAAFRASLREDDPHAGLCRLASPGSFGMKMYSFLLALNRRYPKLAIEFSYAPNRTIVREVLEEKLDMGFVSVDPSEPGLRAEPIDREELRLLVPAGFRGKDFASLCRLGFIDHPDGYHHAGRLLAQNFPGEFTRMEEIPRRGFINQLTRIPEPVAAGLGFTALPAYACETFPDRRRIRYLPLRRKVSDPIFRIWRRHQELPARFTFLMREFSRA